MTTLFDFHDPNTLLTKATKASATRRSGTVADTVRHSLIHTNSPDATLHHAIIAACPHPLKSRADVGEYYMVAYVSIPLDWIGLVDTIVAKDWDISFIGPAGTTQRLPPTMIDMADVLEGRVYIGFDWFWLAQVEPPVQQPHYEKIKPRLIQFVNQLRTMKEDRA
jgi:hypothetical protein